MIFDRKTAIEVPDVLLNTGKRIGFEPLELFHAGLRAAQASLLKGSVRVAVRQVLETHKTGLLIVCGVTGSEYPALAREIAAMAVKDVTCVNCSPLVLDEMTTRAHIKAASVASYHCLVIATLHTSGASGVRDRMTAILEQDVQDADLNLVGIVEAGSLHPMASEGFSRVRSAIELKFIPCQLR